MVAVIEVKRELTTALLAEGYAQLMLRAEAVLQQQPHRTWLLGILADGRAAEVIRFSRVARTSNAVAFRRSGVQPVSRSLGCSGLAMLARLMLASPSELGYRQPTVQGR